jgi:hypothetical protein
MTVAELESTKLEEIASEYRAKGYAVAVRPHDNLPPFLGQFHPDMIATSPHDNVVVEIKSTPELQSPALVRLAEAVAEQPQWRLELVIVNPSTAQEVPAYGELAPDDQVLALLEKAEVLNRSREPEAAVLVAWAAGEAIFRRLTSSEEFEGQRRSSAFLLKHLYNIGAIDAEQYEHFERAMEFRNAFAHGFAARVDRDTVTTLIKELQELRARPAA